VTRLSDGQVARLRAACGAADELAGRYRIERELGRGGMGVVYLAFDAQLERRVAIKTLDVAAVDPRLAARLRREAQLVGALEHPGIVPVHDLGFDAEGTPYYVMRYVDGETLEASAATLGGEAARLRLLLRICEPVAFAHARGVVHRDLKPANVMIGRFGEVWVMDFGLATLADPTFAARDADAPSATAGAARLTEAGAALGTPGYRAPEQEERSSEVTRAADIYALGCVLAFLLTGRHPAQRGSLDIASLAAPLRAIARTACAANPAERYGSVTELAADISRYVDAERVSAYDEPWLAGARRWLRRHRFVVALVATYLALRILFALWQR